MPGESVEVPAAGSARAIPEDLLLDVGIAVFDAPDRGQGDGSVFQNDEVLRAERNYVPYVIGKHLQATETWGAVRVIPRPSAAIDVTVTGTIVRSDGEALVFRAKATDARGVVWFDNEYRAIAQAGAYADQGDAADPFAQSYAALATDMAAALRALDLDDLARIRAVAEVAFARSLVPEAFASHVTPNPDGGHELRRLPAADDPMLARVREVRHREQVFIDQVNDYYDEFTANIREPYDEWRRKAFRGRREQRELKLKADAQVLLGSARIIAGLARMDHDLPGRLGFDWVTRGMGLIRGAETSEELMRDNAASMRDAGSSTQANLLPHTTALENRTARLQTDVDSRYDGLRLILGRLYREEIGLPPHARPREPPPDAPADDPPGSPVVDPSAQVEAAAPAMSRDARLERRTAHAREEIRAGDLGDAIETLNRILDDGENLGTVAAVRIYTLLALGHFARADDRQAMSAFNHVVGTACAHVCSPETLARPVPGRRHHNPMRPALSQFVASVRDEIYHGDFDYAIDMVTGLIGDPDAESPSRLDRDVARSLGVFSLRPTERAALYQTLATAYVGKQDHAAAAAVYETILDMGTRVPAWHRDISNENLALIHFWRKDYKKSLEYQRAWLSTSNWVGTSCAKICPSP